MLGSELLKFFGSSGSQIVIQSTSVDDDTSAAFIIGSDGYCYGNTGGPSEKLSPWIAPQVGMNLYQVMAHATSGTPSGTLDAWVPCTSNPLWGISAPGFTPKSAHLTVSISKISDGVVIATASIFLSATGSV